MTVRLLMSRQFMPYFAAQALGAFNDNFYRNALVLLCTYHFAADDTRQAGWLIAACSALFIVPFFLFSATAGTLTDKMDKAKLVRWLKWTELAVMSVAVIGFLSMNLTLLLIALFLTGSQSAFFGPVKYALLPSLLPKEKLVAGNAWVEAGTFIAILTGTLVGGWLILSAYGREVVAVGCVVISALGVWASYYIPPLPGQHPHLHIRRNIFADSYATLRAGLGQPSLRPHMLAIAWFWALGTVYVANLPLYAKTQLHALENPVPVLLATFTIGIALGSAICAFILRGHISLRTVWPGACLLAIAAADFIWTSASLPPDRIPLRLLADLLLIAIGAGLYVVPHYASLQHRADAGARGRILAASNILNALCMVGLSVIGGVLLHTGLGVAVALGSLAILTPIWLRILPRNPL